MGTDSTISLGKDGKLGQTTGRIDSSTGLSDEETQNWARDMAPQVRVNCLMVGLVETRHGPQTLGWRTLSQGTRATITQHTPLQRLGMLDDVAKAALFLIRDADFMTGQTLILGGGISLVM